MRLIKSTLLLAATLPLASAAFAQCETEAASLKTINAQKTYAEAMAKKSQDESKAALAAIRAKATQLGWNDARLNTYMTGLSANTTLTRLETQKKTAMEKMRAARAVMAQRKESEGVPALCKDVVKMAVHGNEVLKTAMEQAMYMKTLPADMK